MINELHGESQYLTLAKNILKNGKLTSNRTGISAYTIPPTMIQHDMNLGFPLLTTKKMAFKSIKVELEGFIKGITDKRWYQERNCHIWDEWCNPQKIPLGLSDIERKEFQFKEWDLGPIYGAEWRNFNNSGYDQLKIIVETLKTNPYDRRMVCSAWNPLVLDQQALPPCHYSFQVSVIDNFINLAWTQRSVDFCLGLPYNLASYALLLLLLCDQANYEKDLYKPGIITGFLTNCHVYENHLEGIKEQIIRTPYKLPWISANTNSISYSIFDWNNEYTKLENYQFHPKISFEVAV